MVKCPVCESARVVVVVAPSPRAFCVKCSTRGIQEGSHQRAIRPGVPAAPAVRPIHMARY